MERRVRDPVMLDAGGVPAKLYVVSHRRSLNGGVDMKFLGLFANLETAVSAVNDLKKARGFKDFPKGFLIQEFTVDSSHG
jgi:hypothetical protein